jgi:hypothetical protein
VLPTIRYAVSPAGRIAYTTAGAGPPLLCDSGWVTHLRGQRGLFSFGAFAEQLAEQLAERFTVIRYDKPGFGRRQVTAVGARACLTPAMEAFYQLPFEQFERHCPYGTADEVAGFLAPYAAAGCTEFDLIPQSPDPDEAVAQAAAVRQRLAAA